eukprot:TRINITY_DN5725_c0_g1_i1.p1 TRINITY_DN5725_c0_g1~~TRINITY_DN5725_c0_g1_i1.p1  ORF type:complete len:653 (-),score=110.95 TRINITY_DN5725_c0_g1_i1:309-2267(-)
MLPGLDSTILSIISSVGWFLLLSRKFSNINRRDMPLRKLLLFRYKFFMVDQYDAQLPTYAPILYPLPLSQPILQSKFDNLVILSNEAQQYDVSNYHEPKEGRIPGPRPACLDVYLKILEEKERSKKHRSSTVTNPSECTIALVESDYPFSPVTPDLETNVRFDQNNVPIFCSLPKFIELLTVRMDNQCTLTPFLALIPVLTTRHQILDLLIQRYRVPLPIDPALKEEWEKQLRAPIAFRVINMVKSWIQFDWEAFVHDVSLKDKLLNFIEAFEEADKPYISSLNATIKNKEQAPHFEELVEETNQVDTETANVLSWEAHEIAQQLTLAAYHTLLVKIPLEKILTDHSEIEISYPDHVLNAILEKATDKEGGVEVKDRRKVFKTYNKSFVAQEFVQWLQKHMSMTREDAIGWGKHMQKLGFIENLSGRGDFDSAELFFRFKPREEESGRLNMVTVNLDKVFSLHISPKDSEFSMLIKKDLLNIESFIFNDIQQTKSKGENYTRQILRKWISVACELERLNNHHSLFGIINSVYKFGQSPENAQIWDRIPDQNRQWLSMTLFNYFPSGELLQKEMTRSPPCIPFFPSFFGFARRAGNLKNSDGLLNIAAIGNIGEILYHFKCMQQTPFQLAKNKSLSEYLNKKFCSKPVQEMRS